MGRHFSGSCLNYRLCEAFIMIINLLDDRFFNRKGAKPPLVPPKGETAKVAKNKRISTKWNLSYTLFPFHSLPIIIFLYFCSTIIPALKTVPLYAVHCIGWFSLIFVWIVMLIKLAECPWLFLEHPANLENPICDVRLWDVRHNAASHISYLTSHNLTSIV